MRLLLKIFLLGGLLPAVDASAQTILSLDSCRSMALHNNKQLGVSAAKQEMTRNMRKSARTKYLPHVNAFGGYVYSSREISLLSDDQKIALGNIGTTADQMLSAMGMQLPGLGATLNGMGQGIVDALRTDTRNVFAGSVMLTQPVFMGGAIVALNKMADLQMEMAANSTDATRQLTLYNVDQAYWSVVSLKHKKKLAESYLGLVKKLDDDVAKMIREGVATRADGLKVGVKLNEAEMTLIQVDDGLALSKMLLCQLCGLDVNEDITLEDESSEQLTEDDGAILPQDDNVDMAFGNRPELKLLDQTVELSRQNTNLLKAGNLPKVALFGGYTVTNPSVYNSFEKKFGGAWNVGVLVSVPVWNWGDVAYKVRASKNATTMAMLERDEAREKIELQVSQSNFKVEEAMKKLALANASIKRAEENLRCANVGFREGVIPSSDLMEAQTAWLQAQSQRIDAEIDVKLSRVNLQKALGTLKE